MHDRSASGAVVAASIAAGLGTASAAVSAYWVLGGTALLDTIGGEIERWGRQRSAGVIVALWAIVVCKLIAARLPLVVAGVGSSRLPAWTRAARHLGWAAALGLTVYGGVLTVAGLLVDSGVIDRAADADERALAWQRRLRLGSCTPRALDRQTQHPVCDVSYIPPWILRRGRRTPGVVSRDQHREHRQRAWTSGVGSWTTVTRAPSLDDGR